MPGYGSKIILGVSGSIAAYKAADLASRLKKLGHDVTAILTRSAAELVSPNTFLNLTGNRVYTALFDPTGGQTEHIALTDRADLVIVAPATANVIAKMAVGLADDMLSTTLLAVRCPVLVCPAMNTRMWEHPTVRRNLVTIRREGARVLEPDAGALACGHVGPGRLAEPEAIVLAATAILKETPRKAVPVVAPPSGTPPTLFLERQARTGVASSASLEEEARYRATLAAEGALVGSGPVGSEGSESLHLHRASTVDEVRARAEASPLARAGVARFEVAAWRADLGELAARNGASPGSP